MSLPRYKEYKDSGVEWLGAVPKHWVVVPIKAFGRLKGGAGFPHDEQGIQGQELEFFKVNSLAAADVTGLLQRGEHTISRDTAARLGAFVFPVQSIVFAKVGAALMLGRVREIAKPACIDNNMMGLMVSKSNDVKFVRYAMSLVRFDLISNPGAVPSLNEGQIGNFVLTRPPLAEQTAIATFLDRETAKIHALIAEQEKLIALLAEKRQATISYAVTKGLNPHALMKDSGVAWLGEIPAHWEVVPLMHLTHPARPIMYGIVLPGPNVDGGIPIVKGGDVKEHRLKLELLNRTTADIEAPFARARLRPLDIVYSIRGTIGDAEVVPDELADANITQDVARISPALDIQTRWLLHVMKAKPIFVQLEQRSLGAAVRGINIFELKRARIPVPPASERNSIAKFLDDETLKIDVLKVEAERTIRLLKERRSALIAAAVTGQIDVRGVTSQTAAENLEAIAA